MYTREIQKPRVAPIENGIPLTGTWNKAFAQVDLLGIQRPYRWPLPRWVRDHRIKEWESFSVQDDRFFLEAHLANFKLLHIAQVFLYDKEEEKNYTYRKMLPGNNWRMPRSLNHALVECHSADFLFRIHTWLNADTIKLDLDIGADRRQPAFTAHLAYCLADGEVMPAAVSLNFAERRNMYAYKTLASVRPNNFICIIKLNEGYAICYL